jgi:hypothetical protein
MVFKTAAVLAILFILLFSQSGISSSSISLKPYSNGYFTLVPFKNPNQGSIDTILFANGLKIYCYEIALLVSDGSSWYYSMHRCAMPLIIASLSNKNYCFVNTE